MNRLLSERVWFSERFSTLGALHQHHLHVIYLRQFAKSAIPLLLITVLFFLFVSVWESKYTKNRALLGKQSESVFFLCGFQKQWRWLILEHAPALCTSISIGPCYLSRVKKACIVSVTKSSCSLLLDITISDSPGLGSLHRRAWFVTNW